MNIIVVKITKPKTNAILSLAEEYLSRSQQFAKVEQMMFKTDEQFLDHIKQKKGHLVTLDVQGASYDSKEFSVQLEKYFTKSLAKILYLVVGGPYGLSQDLKTRSDSSISLSHLTLPSDLAWLVLCEQLYRALTIMKGLPYHHE